MRIRLYLVVFSVILWNIIRGDFIEYYHNEFIANENYKYLKLDYTNSYSKFIKFSYNVLIQNAESYDQSSITLFAAITKDHCDLYEGYLKHPEESQMKIINDLSQARIIYLKTKLTHNVPMDNLFKRNDNSQFICFIYHSPHRLRKFSNKVRQMFIKHSIEVKYDLKYLYFHFVFLICLFCFVLTTYYIKWNLKKLRKTEEIIQNIRAQHK